MFVKKMQLGSLGTNCYIVGCERTKKALVIDPADEGERILEMINNQGFTLEKIINTHGHWDHIGANAYIKAATGAEICIHEADELYLEDEKLNGKAWLAGVGDTIGADRLLKDGDQITVGSLELNVLHTPGHTPGCICLLAGKNIFTGDTLFACSIGRTDLAGGSYAKIIESIKTKLQPLADDIEVFPGHGPSSNMGYEKKHNPFLK